MPDSEKQKRETATNRLLDLLRAKEMSATPQEQNDSERASAPEQSPSLVENIQSESAPHEPASEAIRGEFPRDLFDMKTPIGKMRFSTRMVNSLGNILNQSSQMITIHMDGGTLNMLEFRHKKGQKVVTKLESISLPLLDGETVIEDDPGLLDYYLNKFVTDQKDKGKYLSFSSDRLQTATKGIFSEKLKSAEYEELVKWTVNKHLPIKADRAVVDFKVLPALNGNGKKQCLVSACDENDLLAYSDIFQKRGLKMRQVSPYSILLWKLFVHNYPDRKNRNNIIVYLGQKKSTVIIVKNNQLIHSRKMNMGTSDFTQAMTQRFVENNQAIQLDKKMAEELLFKYGIRENENSTVPENGINLNKIYILLRPVFDKLVSELDRSFAFFKKEDKELELGDVIFTGPGSAIPNMVQFLGEELENNVELLNPNRQNTFAFEGGEFSPDHYVKYALNFAHALNALPPVNLMEPAQRQSEKYLFRSNVALAVFSILSPIILVSTLLAYVGNISLGNTLTERKSEWVNTSNELKNFHAMANDIEIWNAYVHFLNNDRAYSRNQIKMLQFLTNIVPADIKLIGLDFELLNTAGKNDGNSLGKSSQLTLKGVVDSPVSMADIKLTNFVMKLENEPIIKQVTSKVDDLGKPGDRLFFNLAVVF